MSEIEQTTMERVMEITMTPKYTAMTTSEMLQECGDDASKWTSAYCQYFPEADWGTMVGWFANAIEHGIVARREREMRQQIAAAEGVGDPNAIAQMQATPA